MNRPIFIAIYTLLCKECHRVLRLWTQTLLPPVITMTLYFFIFGRVLGQYIGDLHGLTYGGFIAPGLVMLGMLSNAYMNSSSSVFIDKFQGSFQEVLVSPIPAPYVVIAIVLGSIMRGMMVAVAIAAVGWLCVGAVVQHYWIALSVVFLSSALFGVLGLLNGLYANHFDDINFIPSLVLSPLIFLGGVFYPVSRLPDFWQAVSYYNPLVYLIQSMRLSYTSGAVSAVFFLTLILMILLIGLLCSIRINRRVGVSVR